MTRAKNPAKEQTALALPIDLKASFDKLAQLEQAAAQIKAGRNEGTTRAYILIISHLSANGAKLTKRDKVAEETFNELIKLGVSKAKARRYIEMSQAFRRSEKLDETTTIEFVQDRFAELEISKETNLRNYLFPKEESKYGPWFNAAVNGLAKYEKIMYTTKGEKAANDDMQAILGEIWEAAATKLQENAHQKKTQKPRSPKDAS